MKRIQPPLVILRQKLIVPHSVYENKNYLEAQAVVSTLNRVTDVQKSYSNSVSGTENTRNLELYGWKNPICVHVDSSFGANYTYLTILDNNDTEIGVRHNDGTYTILCPTIGDIVRLDDSFPHFTSGLGSCVALFCGTFKRSCDAAIARKMQRGINRLASDIRSPKVPSSYQIDFFHGECYVAGKYQAMKSTLKVAKRQGYEVLRCIECGEPATHLDKQYPYGDHHKCRQHKLSASIQ